jgi:hypothetical protein
MKTNHNALNAGEPIYGSEQTRHLGVLDADMIQGAIQNET